MTSYLENPFDYSAGVKSHWSPDHYLSFSARFAEAKLGTFRLWYVFVASHNGIARQFMYQKNKNDNRPSSVVQD